MTTISHKNLTGSQLHESKGVASASANLVYVTNGSGSGVWQKLTASQLSTTGNAFGGQLFHCRTTASTTVSGGTNVSGAFTKRVLDSTLTNEIVGASISNGVFVLPAGTYYTEGYQNFWQTAGTQTRLRDTTSSLTLILGASNYANNDMSSHISGRFTLASTKNLEYQYSCQTANSNGLGFASSSGETEIYAELLIWKVA